MFWFLDICDDQTKCLTQDLVCDEIEDCEDGTDEIQCGGQEGHSRCVFPFIYRDFRYTRCTSADTNAGATWCALSIKPGGKFVPSAWGWCNAAGTMGSRPCVFPFKYKGIAFSDCTTADYSHPWCPLAVDNGGNYIHGAWGEC